MIAEDLLKDGIKILRQREYSKKWRLKNAEKLKRKARKRYWDNPELYRERARLFRQKNPKKHARDARLYHRKLKTDALLHYSNGALNCACCGEDRIEFLSIDHVNGGGTAHRKELSQKGTRFYLWLRRNNFPPGFRVLCYNCNIAIGHLGYCPHQVEKAIAKLPVRLVNPDGNTKLDFQGYKTSSKIRLKDVEQSQH